MTKSNDKKISYPGISRIDSKHTHGWYVRVYANGGVLKSKLFSDRIFGGKKQALDNAKKFRDHYQMVAALHKSKTHSSRRKPFYKVPPKNNTSGVVGVNEVKTRMQGRDVHYFQATWSEEGKAKSKKFYITSKRTREEAYKLAVDLRKSKEEMLQSVWTDNSGKEDSR
jgi:hypothetical protein